MLEPLLLLLAWLAEAFLLLAAAMALLSHRLMVRIGRRGEKAIADRLVEKGEIGREALELPWIRERIPSPFGYELAVYGLRGEGDRLAVFHHGVGWNWMGVIKYMEILSREGWSVAALDSRGHGASGGKDPSYGFFEKGDLLALADWALASFPASGGFAAFGLSLGAASVLEYAPLDPRLDAVVADCPFSSAAEELDHRLKRSFAPFFLRPLVVRLMDLLCRRLDGFSLYAASPGRAILETDKPILLIHGLDDDYVPWRMSASMAKARRRLLPGAATELLLVEGAAHARSHKAGPEAYERRLLAFLDSALRHRVDSSKAPW